MTGINTLLVDQGPGETRVAVLAGDTVIEVYHHRKDQPVAGAFYNGRISKPLPDGSAVFVEIGLDRPALMPCEAKPLPEGKVVLVEITQPPRRDKGAKVRLVKKVWSDDSTSPSRLGVVKPADHAISKCIALYANVLDCVIIAAPNHDIAIEKMLGPNLRIDRWNGQDNLFEYFGVEEAIELALSPSVAFPGGGKLIIETTAALTTVDIDAGPLSAADANKAAMIALAYELRLRNISGPIIVDLIPAKHRGSAVMQLKRHVADDPVPTRVVGLTPEGRIELNRRRLRLSLADQLLDPPEPGVLSLEAIAYRLLRRCVRLGLVQKATRLTLYAHWEVIGLLQDRLRTALDESNSVLKLSINLVPVKDKPRSWSNIEL